ncbi:hypothetical protein D3C75_660050 [compost metagenome]
MEGGAELPLVQTQHELVGHVVDGLFRVVPALGRTDAVAGQVLEQRAAVLDAVDVPGLAPGHHALGQHVVHHGADQAEHADAAPEPLVDPGLDNRQVVRILLEHELDALEAEGHVPRLVGLRREAEGDGGHVAVVGGAGHERHEQQVGQHVLEAEADGDHELERAGSHGVVEERTGHRGVPDAVAVLGEAVEAVVELVVVGQRVDLRLRVADLVDGLHLAGDLGADAGELAADAGEALVGGVLAGADGLQEHLQRRQVAGVGDVQVAVVLRVGVDDGVELALLLGLVLPVGVHGQAEGVFPLVPVVNLDAFVLHVGEHFLLGAVGGLPAEIAGEQLVLVFQAQLLVGGFHVHGGVLAHSFQVRVRVSSSSSTLPDSVIRLICSSCRS